MDKNELTKALTTTEQIKDVTELIKLLSKLTPMQAAKVEGVAIGLTMERPAQSTA